MNLKTNLIKKTNSILGYKKVTYLLGKKIDLSKNFINLINKNIQLLIKLLSNK